MLATMTSRARHSTQSTEVMDFDSLVWPPPELRPPPTPVPIVVHGAGGKTYKVYPGQRLSEARKLAKQEQSGSGSRSIPIHAPIPRTPLNPAALQSISPPPSTPAEPITKTRGRFGCKDFPAGYVPTPRPPSPPAPAIASQSHFKKPRTTRSRVTHNTPVGFFEPIGAVPHSYDPDMETDDFLSPVMENGRVVSLCRISGASGLTPGGVIEKGWTQAESSGLYPTTSGVGGLTPSPLKYAGQVEPTSYSPYSHGPTHAPFHHQSSRVQVPSESPVRPTRKGYWNRRGDTLSPSGHLIPATPSQAYPPDLAHYPTYTLMDECGRTLLPEDEEDRVLHWRNV